MLSDVRDKYDRWLEELDELATEFRYRGMSPDKAEEAAIRLLAKRYPHIQEEQE